MEIKYTTNIGDYLVIQITAMFPMYIAEVVQSDPLILKVKETGVFSQLKYGDYIIMTNDSNMIQEDEKNDICKFLQYRSDKNLPPVQSGLSKLGVIDGKLHEILYMSEKEKI